MPATRALRRYRRAVEEAVMTLGRDDLGVSVAEEGGGMLAVTFSRGSRAHTAHLGGWELQDRGRARAVVKTALLAFSKRIAQETLARGAA